MIHLDTNFLIHSLRKGTDEDRKLREWLQNDVRVGISAVTWAEFLCGPLSEGELDIAMTLFPNVEVFDAEDAREAASLFNKTGRRSRSLADCMIAAVAIRVGAPVATRNFDDFKDFVPYGLMLALASEGGE